MGGARQSLGVLAKILPISVPQFPSCRMEHMCTSHTPHFGTSPEPGSLKSSQTGYQLPLVAITTAVPSGHLGLRSSGF